MARLIVRCPDETPRPVELAGERFRIGSARDNDVVLEAAGVAEHHAEILVSRGVHVARALAPAVVLVNRATVSDAARLRDGDEIRLGDANLVFEQGDTARPPAPPPFREQRVSIDELRDAAREGEGRRFAVLYDVGRKVLSMGSVDEVVERVLPMVLECVDAERGVLLLRDPETGEMRPHGALPREASTSGALHVPRSIVDAVVNGRVGLLTSDASDDPRFRSHASVQSSHVRSALCAPLWVDDEVLGVVYLDSRIATRAFGREDLVLLSAIANLIALRLKQESLTEQLVEERVVRSGLERYHSPDVVEEILARTRERGGPEIGLEEREVTVLFADLQGLTPLAEAAAPAIVAERLNEYYTLATRIVFERGGSVNEYVGDSVMAIFGAPVFYEDHALRAFEAARALIGELVRRGEEGLEGFGSRVRVAINSGRAVVGTVGSPNRLKYAVVGDVVNVAARLEGLGEPNSITLGEETARRLPPEVETEGLGPQQLRGREQPVRAFRVRV